MPGGVIHHDMDMADTWCDLQRIGPEYRLDAQVFSPVLNKDRPLAQRAGKRWIDNQLSGRLWTFQRGNRGRAVDVGSAEVIQRCRPRSRLLTPEQVQGAVNNDGSSESLLNRFQIRFQTMTDTENHFYVSGMFAGNGVLYRLVSVALRIQWDTFHHFRAGLVLRTIAIASPAITSVSAVETHIAPAIPSVLFSHA